LIAPKNGEYGKTNNSHIPDITDKIPNIAPINLNPRKLAINEIAAVIHKENTIIDIKSASEAIF
jgi:hypothetical protein